LFFMFPGRRVRWEMVPVRRSGKRSYAAGYKYCSRCRLYYLTDELRCMHCGIALRSRPRKKSPPKTQPLGIGGGGRPDPDG